MTINDIAKLVRLSNSMTINDVAELTNLHNSTIARIESKQRRMTEKLILEYNRIFNIDIIEIYEKLEKCNDFKIAFLVVLQKTYCEYKIICINDMLRLIRVANNLKIKELSTILGTPSNYISEVESYNRVVGDGIILKYSFNFNIKVKVAFRRILENNYSFQESLSLILLLLIKSEENKNEKITC